MPGPDQNFVGPGRSGLVRNSGPILFLVRSGGPEFRTDLNWSGPLVRNSGPTFIGPVRRSGIPDQQILVRSVGPEFRTGPTWSGKVVRISVRNSGPDQFWSGLVRISKCLRAENTRSAKVSDLQFNKQSKAESKRSLKD